jgi:3-oxoacyl-[acyl-carrier protein] reductase
MSPLNTLHGRVALITGASGGIGGQTALALAAEGVDFALAHGTHIEDAANVAAQAREMGRRVILLAGDLSDPSVPADLVSQTVEQLGALDVLFASAGIGQRLSWDEVDFDTRCSPSTEDYSPHERHP